MYIQHFAHLQNIPNTYFLLTQPVNSRKISLQPTFLTYLISPFCHLQCYNYWLFEQKISVRNILQMCRLDYECRFWDIYFYFGVYRKNFRRAIFLAPDVKSNRTSAARGKEEESYSNQTFFLEHGLRSWMRSDTRLLSAALVIEMNSLIRDNRYTYIPVPMQIL